MLVVNTCNVSLIMGDKNYQITKKQQNLQFEIGFIYLEGFRDGQCGIIGENIILSCEQWHILRHLFGRRSVFLKVYKHSGEPKEASLIKHTCKCALKSW